MKEILETGGVMGQCVQMWTRNYGALDQTARVCFGVLCANRKKEEVKRDFGPANKKERGASPNTVRVRRFFSLPNSPFSSERPVLPMGDELPDQWREFLSRHRSHSFPALPIPKTRRKLARPLAGKPSAIGRASHSK
ncbi:hypothetical protein TNCV_328421 [Trichonephila clavipes]|nr:hypothetical protein TNCV_328421 [Trichonephila clavipes]